MKHEKIGPQHLVRKSILDVRQSSAHQVLHNRESSALQYAMRERFSDLGWSQIETVDDGLSHSAAGGVMLQACLRHNRVVGSRHPVHAHFQPKDRQQLLGVVERTG